MRERVREFRYCQFVEYLVAEDLEKPVKFSFLVLPFLAYQFLTQIIVQQLAARCERHRKLLRAPGAFRRRRKEALQQLTDCLDAILVQLEFSDFEIGGMAQRLALNAILVDPDEVQVVGENDVLGKALVAFDLIGFQNLVEVFADRLVLDVTENEAAFGDFKIRWETPLMLSSASACNSAWSAERSVCSVFSSIDVLRSARR